MRDLCEFVSNAFAVSVRFGNVYLCNGLVIGRFLQDQQQLLQISKDVMFPNIM